MTVGGTSLPNPVDVNLPLVAGQGLQITNGATSYFIRCLPSDFPTYSAAVTVTPNRRMGTFYSCPLRGGVRHRRRPRVVV